MAGPIYRNEIIPTFTPAAAPTINANEDILSKLIAAANQAYQQNLTEGTEYVGDAMQQRRMRNSGIHAQSLSKMLQTLLAQKTAADQANALNVAQFGLNQQQLEQALNMYNQGQQQQLGMFNQSQAQNWNAATQAQMNQQAAQNAASQAGMWGSVLGAAGALAGANAGGGQMSSSLLAQPQGTGLTVNPYQQYNQPIGPGRGQFAYGWNQMAAGYPSYYGK